MGWLSIKETAAHLQLSDRTVRRMIAAGSLRSKMENGRRLVLFEGQSNGSEDETNENEIKDQREIKPPEKKPTRTYKILTPLFHAYESLVILESRCEELMVASLLMQNINSSHENEIDMRSRELCKRLYLNVRRCKEDIASIVTVMRIPTPQYQSLLEQVYLTMVNTNDLWPDYVINFLEQDEIREGEILIEEIIEDIKKVLIRCTSNPKL